MKSTYLLFLLIVFTTFNAISQNNKEDSKYIPEPTGIINDYDSLFSEIEKTELSKVLYDYDKKTTRQITVVTISELPEPKNVQKYATDIGQAWGVGSAEKNNGVVILFCKNERKIGIATGSGTEKLLTDFECKEVIDKIMIPEFMKGKYYSGIKEGIKGLISRWN